MNRIMLIHHSGVVGGAGVSFVNTVKTIAPYNTVTVYVPSEPMDIYEMLDKIKNEYGFTLKTYGRRIGAITYYSGGDSFLSLRLYYRVLLAFKQIGYWNREIKSNDPDVVCVNSKILCWMSRLKEIRKRKSVCFVRETMSGNRNSLPNRLIAAFLDHFSSVAFLSDYDRDRERLSKAATAVIHNYIDPTQFDRDISRDEARQTLGLRPTAFVALYVGGVSAMKGFDLAVDAVLNTGAELLVLGNDFEDAGKSRDNTAQEYARIWEEKIRQQDTGKRIHMLGRRKDMSLYYTACDVLLFPMRAPHQSRPVFEAGYFSKPVIISDFENIQEFVKDGYNGFLVQTDCSADIAEKINYLRSHPEQSAQMGQNNRSNTEKLHDREKNCALARGILEG